MPCTVDIGPNDEINHYQVLLCQACKFLSTEQINSLQNPGSGIYDGLWWYSNHLMNDYIQRCHNEDELRRSFETNDDEKKNILMELNRIGYDLVESPYGIQLISIRQPINDVFLS